MVLRHPFYAVFLAMIALLISAGCALEISQPGTRYITWDGIEPDKWASVWLIKRHIDPQAEVVLRPVGAPTDSGIAFGVPDAKYKRAHGVSIYESLREGFQKDDPALQELSRIIHDIEISPWAAKTSEHSDTVEQAFRQLQDHFETRIVPVDCYGRFFDEVYALLSAGSADSDWDPLYGLAEKDPACRAETSTLASRDNAPFVRRLDTHVVLDHFAADKNVVFVDVREPLEYDEFHIPGAINLRLRDVRPEMKARFEDADLVIAYCIKDFRGFEMARSLAEIGVQNVGIMKPYGIAGWRHLGLPVTSRGGLSEREALDKLGQCARDVGRCIPNSS